MTEEQADSLANYITISPRFSRAVTLSDDASSRSLDGYVPTARALEVLRRIAHGVERDRASRAFAIIGPYGSGKSSLAVLLAALTGSRRGPAAKSTGVAKDLLQTVAPELAEQWRRVVTSRASRDGWAHGFGTAARREPAMHTIVAALARAAAHPAVPENLRKRIAQMRRRTAAAASQTVSSSDVLEVAVAIAAVTPLLLVLDEFGKNLEAFADDPSDGDLYLLQLLAEAASNRLGGAMMVVVTIQHLAFETYAEAATVAQRREWAKVQGRFEEIPFVDSGAGVLQLVGRALRPDPQLADVIAPDVQRVAETAARLGLPASGSDTVAGCYPLHPVALSVLPDLCARFGQNERTLFSFLASTEPLAVPSLLRRMDPPHKGRPAPWIRLDGVYDYFVESASALAGVSSDATRWTEIVTTLRDSATLSEPERLVLKTVGVLNLVSARGSTRASSATLTFALQGSHPCLEDDESVRKALHDLEHLGVVVFRDFADEYRLWRGSDFDLAEALTLERVRLRGARLSAILDTAYRLPPVVAGRHSVRTLTVRSFQQTWMNPDAYEDLTAALRNPVPHDGTVLLATDGPPPDELLSVASDTAFPVLLVMPEELAEVRSAAVEVQALRNIRDGGELPVDDTAVRNEIQERLDHTIQVLGRLIDVTFGRAATWTWLNPPGSGSEQALDLMTSAALSGVFDIAYEHAPSVRYEAINRHELTSQGAKIRTSVIRSLVEPSRRCEPTFGFAGGSGEDSAHFALFRDPGFDWKHGAYCHPSDRHRCNCISDEVHQGRVAWARCWEGLIGRLDGCTGQPISVTSILRHSAAPPFGLRTGVSSVMLATALVLNPDRYTLYEHGTFVPRLDDAILERMTRNPDEFMVSAPQVDSPKLRRGLHELQASLDAAGVPFGSDKPPSVPNLATRIARVLQTRGDRFTQTSRLFERVLGDDVNDHDLSCTIAVRDAVLQARDPFSLLFVELPLAVGMAPVHAGHGGTSADEAPLLAEAVASAVARLWACSDRLASFVAERVVRAATGQNRLGPLMEHAVRLDRLPEHALPNNVRQLVLNTIALDAALRERGDEQSRQKAVRDWIRAIATNLTGRPLEQWRDGDVEPLARAIEADAEDLRHCADLAAVTDGEDGAFSIRLVGNGCAVTRVVRVPAEVSALTNIVVDDALERLSRALGDDDHAALDALLAVAAHRNAAARYPAQVEDTQ